MLKLKKLKIKSLTRTKNQQGFSLLEILVAFSILALSLGLILKIFSSGLQTAGLAENYTLAVEIAESLLAKTGEEQKLALGESSGQKNDYFNWRIQITAIELEISPQLPPSLAEQIVQVKITVSWGDEKNPRSIDLTTLKLMPSSHESR
jgi:general secretion pathway protein I